MTPRAARGFAGLAAARRERLERERTAAQLARQRELEREVAEQLEPLLGPAGRPVGETAMALWRRRHADAYLALPPWRRAWRTWVSWDRLRRGLAVLVLALVWTLVCLPLRMLGLASLEVSQAGVAVALVAAPLVAALPPARRGRFVDPMPAGGSPWRRSRRAGRLARFGALAAALGVAVVAVLAILGPGPAAEPEGRITAAARAADAVLVRHAVAAACGPGADVRLTPLDASRYRLTTGPGAVSTVAVSRDTGFASGVRHVTPLEGRIACPAP
jgi:hypothetical protein